MHYFSNKY